MSKEKIEVRKQAYTITDGNGGTLQAQVVEKTKVPKRVLYRVRRSNRGRYGVRIETVTLQAFRKLMEQA